MPASWASSTGCKYKSQHPPQKVRTQENLLSIQTAFRRAGSAAESTFNLLSNYIMEQGTNCCVFPALLKRVSRALLFLWITSALIQSSSEKAISESAFIQMTIHIKYTTHRYLFVLNSTFLDGYTLSIHLGNETWPEMWRICKEARSNEEAAALLAAKQLLI